MANKGTVKIATSDYAQVIIAFGRFKDKLNSIETDLQMGIAALKEVYNGDGLDKATEALDNFIVGIREMQVDVNKCAFKADSELSKISEKLKEALTDDTLDRASKKLRKE